ncbi:MAG: minichromosome maintenance protein MCM [Candidatus Helarchaeota archaeon]
MALEPREKIERFFNEFTDSSGVKKYREKIKAISQLINRDDKRRLIIDFNDLFSFDPSIARKLINEPDLIIAQASEAILNVLKKVDEDYYNTNPEITPRFFNIDKDFHVELRGIRAEHIGRLICVSAIINSTGVVKPQIVLAAFECNDCGHIQFIEQEITELRLIKPNKCEIDTCSGKQFKLNIEKSVFIDRQKIRAQEKPEELPAGQLPRSVNAILLKDLVDMARPGDRVKIIGIMRTREDQRVTIKLTTFHTYIEVNYLEIEEKDIGKLEISPEDEKRIIELSKDPYIHSKITKSIAPWIFGYEDIKEAIACLLFSTAKKENEEEDGMKIRGVTHIFLVGDPGTGKSQILQHVKQLAPRGLYTSGKGSTAAGLTAAVMRDKDTGEMALEAGALVISDQGVACIDEFDKMNKQDRTALHEAMEQMTVSIAKAGILANLNARTSILAAANPDIGKYNPNKTLAENVKSIPISLLSRFDLSFILEDEPDKDKDFELSSHILSLQDEKKAKPKPPIETSFMRKYIAYARSKEPAPVPTQECLKAIQDFYLKIRETASEDTPIPITARQLEGMVRLAIARARMALREKATIEDAEAAIRLMKVSFGQVGTDEISGKFDVLRAFTGKSASQRNKLTIILDIITKLSKDNPGQSIATQKIIEIAREKGIDERETESHIKTLLRDGTLYEPSQNHVNFLG